MTKKQILILTLAFLLGVWLAEIVAAQSQINGPDQTKPGTLTTFEITPAQVADWTITSIETTEKIYQTDTSTNRLYFATPKSGTYHIVAAIVVDGKPQLLTRTLVNGNSDDITPPPPRPPDTPLAEWIKTELPSLVKSQTRNTESQLVAKCFEQTVQRIENDAIKTAQNARAQLQIALTTTLAFTSETAIDDWHEFLTQLSQQMAKELGDKVNDVHAVQNVFQTVAKMLNETSGVSPQTSENSPTEANRKCFQCQPQPTNRFFQQFR